METNGLIYLNTASCGLLLPETITAANKLYADMATNASTASENWRLEEFDSIKETIADFLNAPANNIAFVPNFSWGLNGIVQSLKGTEKILLYKNDYPSLTEPFKINKFDITWADARDDFNINMEQVQHAIKNREIDIVAISHVQWLNGYKTDIKAIGDLCKEHGVLFFVDATQSMGAHHIDLKDLHIDVFGASNYKWMNAAFGSGIMYVSDSFMKKYPPVVGGNNSYKMLDGKLQYVSSIQSYEPGHPGMFSLSVLRSAVKQKMELGVKNIEIHNRKLTQLLLDKLSGIPVKWLGDDKMDNRAPILFLKDDNGLGEWLKLHNIIVTHRNGYLRTSIHFYNTETDIMALVNSLKAKFL